MMLLLIKILPFLTQIKSLNNVEMIYDKIEPDLEAGEGIDR